MKNIEGKLERRFTQLIEDNINKHNKGRGQSRILIQLAPNVVISRFDFDSIQLRRYLIYLERE